MRLVALIALVVAPAAAQTSIGPNGIRSNGTVIDGSGIHGPGGSIDATGIHSGGPHRTGATSIDTNNGHRSVDCRGGALQLNGNGNTLDVVNCSAVMVAGNGNTLTVRFSLPGRLAVAGNRNDVSWRASKGTRVSAAVTGSGNSVRRTAWS